MSVLVKGMEIPKSCSECFIGFCKQIGCENYIGFDTYKESRHPECPLVELPPKHGRLIDCDALVEIESTQYSNVMKDGQRDWFEKCIADLIHKTLEVTLTEKNAPTVLEAEGVEGNA